MSSFSLSNSAYLFIKISFFFYNYIVIVLLFCTLHLFVTQIILFLNQFKNFIVMDFLENLNITIYIYIWFIFILKKKKNEFLLLKNLIIKIIK